ncbi:MAG: type II toxin-antitoxin system RelE/ParE family toxin [Deltaproteobacteria bacterium]|nr:type II toxin-antitoxin system RelE/ParE family toxin [Deltaproteobacteria bacterium]
MRWAIGYYSEEVRLEIEPLPVGVRASYARLTELLEEFGVDLRMPHSRAMGGGLFELRLRGPEGIARVLYCTKVGKRIVILHSFVKKTQETPKRDLEVARRRQREVSKS